MRKLNPLHIEKLAQGTDPAKIDTGVHTGRTTANALSLLAAAMRDPNRSVRSLNGGGWREQEAVVQVALNLAQKAGLRHIHPDKTDPGAIIFEYRSS